MKWVRDPLVAFVVIGAAAWILFRVTGLEDRFDPRRTPIVINKGFVDGLRENWELELKRPVANHELESLIDQHIEEEVLYREALLLGLDRGDTIVRRRLVQKMEFIMEDATQTSLEPTNDELATQLLAKPARYATPPRVSFRHVFFGEDVVAASAARSTWRRIEDGEGRGLAFLADRHLFERTPNEVAGAFGSELADEVLRLETGTWVGPLRSSFGVHLVWIEDRREGAPGSLDDEAVHRKVREDVVSMKTRAAQRAMIHALASSYTIEIEPWKATRLAVSP